MKPAAVAFGSTMIFKRKSFPSPGEGPRVLAYCASNIGLGHYIETVRTMAAMKRRRPDLEILLATDSREREMAERAGLARLELPGFEFVDDTQFKERPRCLNVENKRIRALRAAVLERVVKTFEPALIFMDGNPHGKRDEMLPALRLGRKLGARPVMLMRDIPAPPGEKHKLAGTEAQILKHAAHYDRLLISSEREFYDVAETYQWPEAVRAKMAYVGFIAEAVEPRPRAEALAPWPALDPAAPLAVAGFGGGWAVGETAPRLLDAIEQYRAQSGRALQLVLSIGPASDGATADALVRRAGEMGGVVIERFIPGFGAMLGAADLAILQAGFTVYQILEGATPVVLAPRAYSSREQEARAGRLAQLPGIRALEPGSLDRADWPEIFKWALGQGHPARKTGWRFDGAENAAAEALALLGD